MSFRRMGGLCDPGGGSLAVSHVCAGQPFRELLQAEQLMEFDSAETIYDSDYDLAPRRLSHSWSTRPIPSVSALFALS
jgi:hypothetical protein